MARFLPAMSGAVPWAASNRATRTTADGVEREVGAGADAERAGQAARHVGEEVAVLVQHQHDLELLRGHDDLAEQGVEQLDVVRHLGELVGDLAWRRFSNRPSVAFWIVYFEALVTRLPVLRARLKA